MTAYPETCLVDREDGYVTTIRIEAATDADAEDHAIAVLRIAAELASGPLTIRLSQEACDEVVRALVEIGAEVPE